MVSKRASSNPVFLITINAQAHQNYMDLPNFMQSLRKRQAGTAQLSRYVCNSRTSGFFFWFCFVLNIASPAAYVPSVAVTVQEPPHWPDQLFFSSLILFPRVSRNWNLQREHKKKGKHTIPPYLPF